MTASSKVFRVGTRGSRLSRIQTTGALRHLQDALPGVEFEQVPVSSPGDRDRRTDLRESPEDFFTRDLDEMVRSGELDCAIHSAKDVPYPVPEGLDWFWLPWAEDRRDALVLPPGQTADDLPDRSRIGTSSERRVAYATERFPDARPTSVRGNVEDRVAQLDAGKFDAVITAACALVRLGMEDRITEWIPLEDLPTPDGQGTLCLTFRAGDPAWRIIRALFVKAVRFVGAGSGDVENCTLAGKRALESCDACLHDALIDDGLLDLLPDDALRIDVGKRSGRHRVSQSELLELTAEHARKARRVVRLKGGDPGIFGRLEEEVGNLEALSLPYRVIPGMSSLTAGTTGTGMLLTRREEVPGFCVMTARRRGGAVADVRGANRAKLPVVFFMGTKVAGDLARQMIEDGTPPDTPAAFVFGAGGEQETVIRGTLGDVCDRVNPDDIGMPGLFMLGEIARPVFGAECGALGGRRVLLTCSEALMDRARRVVYDLGGVPVARPMIRLSARAEASKTVRRVADYDWLAVTSPSAVRFLMEALRRADVDIRSLPRLVVAGPRTARVFAESGIQVDAVPSEDFGGAGVLKLAESEIPAGSRLLRLKSDKTGTALAEGLRGLGHQVDECVLYHNRPVLYDSEPEFDAVFFASGSAVHGLASQWGTQVLDDKVTLTIGGPSAEVLREHGVEPDVVSPESTVEDALFALARHYVTHKLEELQ